MRVCISHVLNIGMYSILVLGEREKPNCMNALNLCHVVHIFISPLCNGDPIRLLNFTRIVIVKVLLYFYDECKNYMHFYGNL